MALYKSVYYYYYYYYYYGAVVCWQINWLFWVIGCRLWSKSSRLVVTTARWSSCTCCRNRRVQYLTHCTWLTIAPVHFSIALSCFSSSSRQHQEALPPHHLLLSTSLPAPYQVCVVMFCIINNIYNNNIADYRQSRRSSLQLAIRVGSHLAPTDFRS